MDGSPGFQRFGQRACPRTVWEFLVLPISVRSPLARCRVRLRRRMPQSSHVPSSLFALPGAPPTDRGALRGTGRDAGGSKGLASPSPAEARWKRFLGDTGFASYEDLRRGCGGPKISARCLVRRLSEQDAAARQNLSLEAQGAGMHAWLAKSVIFLQTSQGEVGQRGAQCGLFGIYDFCS